LYLSGVGGFVNSRPGTCAFCLKILLYVGETGINQRRKAMASFKPVRSGEAGKSDLWQAQLIRPGLRLFLEHTARRKQQGKDRAFDGFNQNNLFFGSLI
jgi:hypothetical protein